MSGLQSSHCTEYVITVTGNFCRGIQFRSCTEVFVSSLCVCSEGKFKAGNFSGVQTHGLAPGVCDFLCIAAISCAL